MAELRDYQTGIINLLRQSLMAGRRRPVVQAPTGAGKTLVAANVIRMAREKKRRVFFTVPAISLINQTVERFWAEGIREIGVIQANHEMTDPNQPIQVCSVQTLARRERAWDPDLVIVDEAHLQFKSILKWMGEATNIPFVGLTATPWAKGMGKHWDDLIVGITTAELIEKGYLSDFKVFAPTHPDMAGVRTVAGDYNEKDLSRVMNTAPLTADIVSTWLEKGRHRPTLCFCVDRLHAKHVQEEFGKAGIRSGYLDALSTLDERKDVERRFASGDLEVVCNVGVLTTGVDWDVRCIILARPTKSEMLYVQIIGRGLRLGHGKDHCLILDHSDTSLRLGFVTDIHHDSLDNGEGKPTRKSEPPLPKECQGCGALKPPRMLQCPYCGHVPELKNRIEVAEGRLDEITRDKKRVKAAPTFAEKEQFYRELLHYAATMGYKSGWAFHAYRDKFEVKPHTQFRDSPIPVSPGTASWIKHRQIARAKAMAKGAVPVRA